MTQQEPIPALNRLREGCIVLRLVVLSLQTVHVRPEKVVLLRVPVLVEIHVGQHLQPIGLRLERTPAEGENLGALRQPIFPIEGPEGWEHLLLGQTPRGPEDHERIGHLVVRVNGDHFGKFN